MGCGGSKGTGIAEAPMEAGVQRVEPPKSGEGSGGAAKQPMQPDSTAASTTTAANGGAPGTGDATKDTADTSSAAPAAAEREDDAKGSEPDGGEADGSGGVPAPDAEDDGEELDEEAEKERVFFSLYIACQEGDQRVVDMVLSAKQAARIDVNRKYKGATCLFVASQFGNAPIVKRLLDAGADPTLAYDVQGLAPLNVASQNAHHEVCQILLDTGKVDVNRRRALDGFTPLLMACTKGHRLVVEVLLEAKGVDLSLASLKEGASPLAVSIIQDHPTLALALIDHGSDASQKMLDGSSPLLLAAKHGMLDVVNRLLSMKGVEVDAETSEWGFSALHQAVRNEHVDCVRALIQAKADTNKTIRGSVTALMLAAQKGSTEIVRLLIEGGADVNSLTDDKASALACAIVNNHEETAALLRAHGAKEHHEVEDDEQEEEEEDEEEAEKVVEAQQEEAAEEEAMEAMEADPPAPAKQESADADDDGMPIMEPTEPADEEGMEPL